MIRSRLRNLKAPTATPRPIAWFRIGLCSVLLVQALGMVGHLDDLFGRDGIVEWSVNSDALPPGVPKLAWLDMALRSVGVPPGFTIPLVFAVYVTGLAALLLGARTRLAAVVAWLTHTALLVSGDMSMYGVDRFAQIGLFYCLVFPVGDAVSLDAIKKPSLKKPGFWCGRPSFEAWLGLRVLQLHVCIAYTASGVEKALGAQWWNGEALWLAVMGWNNGLVDWSLLAGVPWLPRVLGWMTLLLEAGAVLFVWRPLTRRVWLAGMIGLHLGIAIVMNLWTFSGVMIAFDVAAFGVPARRRALRGADVASLPAEAKGRRPGRWFLAGLFDRRHADEACAAHS
jgi:hypothetical protein